MVGACSAYGGEVCAGFWWGRKPEGKRLLERSRHRWEYNIEMDLHEVGCGWMDWFEVVQDRDRWRALVNVLMNLWVP